MVVVDVTEIVATWLHTVAFVVAWGWFGVLGRIVLPGLDRALAPGPAASALLAIERRALPILGLSVILFVVTGTYLLAVDPEYRGLGNILASPWTVLMAAKHVLVGALVVLAVIVDRSIRRLADEPDGSDHRAVRMRLRLSVEGATGLGALIALLTVIAQAA